MIYLERNIVNRVVLTLSETSTLVDPYYLFEFIPEFSQSSSIFFTTDDLSPATFRYNLFDIELSSTGSTSGGTNVALNIVPGQYQYKVYEGTGQTLSISATTGNVVESGRMIVDIPVQSSYTHLINNIYD
jgi:hypothetical protein